MILLDNATATGTATSWPGGGGIFTAAGTFSGATVTLQYLGPDNSTYITACSLTAAGLAQFSLPPGQIRAAVSGSPTGMYARAEIVRDGGAMGYTSTLTGGGGGAATVADGADVATGAVADAAATAGGTGTISAKLRTLTGALFAEDVAAAGGEVGLQALGVRQDSRVSPVSASGDWHGMVFDANGRLKTVVANAATDWAATGTISNTTTAVTVKAAGGASIRNMLYSVQLSHATLGATTVIQIRDGAAGAVMWQGILDTAAMQPTKCGPDIFISGSNNTLVEIVTLTAVTGIVYYNVQGAVVTS